jgi:NAD(P)-dependent dehydrogenase (short-subunit alcohol dehydrogenase family)
MTNKVVLITGALTGIGRATAIAFTKRGASVVVSGRREEHGNKLADEARSLGAQAEFIKADVRHEEDVRNLVDKTVARFGHLDIAVNNAGTEGQPGLIVDQTSQSLAATFETNVLGTLLSMKYEIRAMQAQQRGSISAALELAGSGIRVNIVAPGPVDTEMLSRFTGTEENKARLSAGVPMKRIGRTEEVAEAIVFVSSDEASFITGARIAVDGGKSAA